MLKLNRRTLSLLLGTGLISTGAFVYGLTRQPDAPTVAPEVGVHEVANQLQVGDVVFIRIRALPFKKVATATGSWTNHVGVVTDVSGTDPLIGESTFPLSRTTTLSRFIARSESGRVAIARTKTPLSAAQQEGIRNAVQKRTGILYDTGFNLHSPRQFCSRFVHEVLDEVTGEKIGTVENFASLLTRHPEADQRFWKIWYFGNIPWQRETVTPASLLESPALQVIFNGSANQAVLAEMEKSIPPYPGNFAWVQ